MYRCADAAPQIVRIFLARIITILPKGEGFSPERFGAVALCVRDFTLASRYGAETLVVGGTTTEGFAAVAYAMPRPARWFENRTRAYAKGCAAIIRRENAALAEIHNRPHLLRLIAAKTACKLALHLHNDPQEMDEARSPGERMRLLALLARVYCVSQYVRDRFMEGLPGGAAEKLAVVYNGITPPEALPAKENTIVFAGRMTEGKGAFLLAQALRIALPHLPGWRALLIGSDRHEAGRAPTPHEKAIAETLEPLGPQATLAGFLSHEETLRHFARAAIAVVPSVWPEPFGRTALEAMAQACALISSGTGGLPEVTADTALTLPEMTPETLAAAISTLAGDEALRVSYGRRARERAQYFTLEARVKVLDEARAQVLSQGARHVA